MEDQPMKMVALFDLDGVVLDTEAQYSAFWNEVGNTFYPEIPRFADRIKGQTAKQIFASYFPDETDRQQIIEAVHRFEERMTYDFIPGVERFLAELRAHGVPTAVVTSSDQKKMARVYAAHPSLQSMFTHIFTAEDFTRSKPHPDCYLLGASYFRVAVENCVVFEDSVNGLKAGRNAGMTVVGLSTTFPESVVAPLCDRVIPDFTSFDYNTFCTLFSSFGRKG